MLHSDTVCREVSSPLNTGQTRCYRNVGCYRWLYIKCDVVQWHCVPRGFFTFDHWTNTLLPKRRLLSLIVQKVWCCTATLCSARFLHLWSLDKHAVTETSVAIADCTESLVLHSDCSARFIRLWTLDKNAVTETSVIIADCTESMMLHSDSVCHEVSSPLITGQTRCYRNVGCYRWLHRKSGVAQWHCVPQGLFTFERWTKTLLPKRRLWSLIVQKVWCCTVTSCAARFIHLWSPDEHAVIEMSAIN
jgi:hypothetical protein